MVYGDGGDLGTRAKERSKLLEGSIGVGCR